MTIYEESIEAKQGRKPKILVAMDQEEAKALVELVESGMKVQRKDTAAGKLRLRVGKKFSDNVPCF